MPSTSNKIICLKEKNQPVGVNMPEKVEKTNEVQKTIESKSGLLVSSTELKRISERFEVSMSDGGGTGVSDSNDNQHQMA